jgi:hypothetical protein
LDRIVDAFHPEEDDWLGDIFGGDVEGDESDGKTKPEKEGNEPTEVFTMEDEAGNPPTGNEWLALVCFILHDMEFLKFQ